MAQGNIGSTMNHRPALHMLDVTLVGVLLVSTAFGVLTQGFTGRVTSSAQVIAGSTSAGAPERVPTRASASATPTPSPSATASLTPTRRPTNTPAPTWTPALTPEASDAISEPTDHYWLSRPIPPNATNFVSRFYPYGSTARGRYQTHHGVEFVNPTGISVLAAASGQVIVAGPDDQQVYGLFPDFYGQLAVIEHTRTLDGLSVFTLYGHLDQVHVRVGQMVETGDVIGEVGEAGIALGPHLHMEVRIGENDYGATRNPELWIEPFEGYGTIAGRVTDAATDELIPAVVVSLYDAQGQWQVDAETYSEGANPDDEWRENFVIGDRPAGVYTVQYTREDSVVTETVTVLAGQTSLVTLELTDPSTGTTATPTAEP